MYWWTALVFAWFIYFFGADHEPRARILLAVVGGLVWPLVLIVSVALMLNQELEDYTNGRGRWRG